MKLFTIAVEIGDDYGCRRAAMGSGANNTGGYVGFATGLTMVTVLVTHAGAASGRYAGPRGPPHQTASK